MEGGMKRNASEKLDRWLQNEERKPLVIRGARQVGKTWLVRDFAKRAGLELVEVNFEWTPSFAEHFTTSAPMEILGNLGAELGRRIDPSVSLLFLDEIQAAPEVLAKLRWFREKMPELPVIAAGSLLEFVLAEHSFSMPVGRISYLYLEPMSFIEFARAVGNDPLVEAMAGSSFDKPLNPSLHARCIKLYRTYCLCGGMPESVQAWRTSGDPAACLAVQQDLLATYNDDFHKYGKNIRRLQKTLRSVSEQLGNKFVASRAEEGTASREIKNALELLCKARIASLVRHSSGNGIPLGSEGNEKFFKVLMLDIGLVAAQLGLARMRPEDVDRLVFQNKGAMAEQFVGQQLRASLADQGIPELHYWQRTGGRQGEIDYLIQLGASIVPVEVKSGSAGAMKSLHQFMFDKQLSQAVRLDVNNFSSVPLDVKTTQGDQVQYTLHCMPIYLAGQVFNQLHSIA
jgi:predicted AAA+ superfamily ATPase